MAWECLARAVCTVYSILASTTTIGIRRYTIILYSTAGQREYSALHGRGQTMCVLARRPLYMWILSRAGILSYQESPPVCFGHREGLWLQGAGLLGVARPVVLLVQVSHELMHALCRAAGGCPRPDCCRLLHCQDLRGEQSMSAMPRE